MNAFSRDPFTLASAGTTQASTPVAQQERPDVSLDHIDQAQKADGPLFSSAFAHIAPGKLPAPYPQFRFK